MKPIYLLGILAGLATVALFARALAGQGKGTDTVTHVNAKEAAKLLAEKKTVVLDVRTPAEFAEGHLAGAKLMDITRPDFEQKLDALDKNQTYLVHCRSGNRSSRALKTLNKLGFKSVIHLDGGLNAWLKAGQPVEK